MQTVPPVNTGDPKNLTDFIVWGVTTYPAERYALVLWNHGSGWKEDDIYARYRKPIDRAGSRGETRAGSRGERLRRSLFLTTAGRIMAIPDEEVRGICYDDSSMDFLDNRELVLALRRAEIQTKQHISLLGMDACLMSMVEVVYQVRNRASVLVGSQENEPGEGWPYDTILRALADSPDMSAHELGQHIVKAYGDFYYGSSRGGGGISTQSAIDLKKVRPFAKRVGAVARQVLHAYDHDFHLEIALGRALQRSERFVGDKDYMDLGHFVELLEREYVGSGSVQDAIAALQAELSVGSEAAPIIANFAGSKHPNARGLSIYFPLGGCSTYYDNLDFAGLGWRDLIHKRNMVTQP